MPTGEEFREEGEKEIKKLIGIDEEKKKTEHVAEVRPWSHAGRSAPRRRSSIPARQAAQDQKQEKFPRFLMTPVDKERADAIHLKISKIAFEATLRFIYVEKRERHGWIPAIPIPSMGSSASSTRRI